MLQYKYIVVVKLNQIRARRRPKSLIPSSARRSRPSTTQQLPTIRELAAALQVSPVTVAAAYRLLRTRGLAVGHGRRGTRLRAALRPHNLPRCDRPSIAEGVVDLATGNPDPGAAALDRCRASRTARRHAPLRRARRTAIARSPSRPLSSRPTAFLSAAVTVTSGALDAVERVLREHMRAGRPRACRRSHAAGLPRSARVARADRRNPARSTMRACNRTRSIARSPRRSKAVDRHTARAESDRRGDAARRAPPISPRCSVAASHVVLIEVDPVGPVSGAPAVTLTDPPPERWVSVKSTSKFLGPDLRVRRRRRRRADDRARRAASGAGRPLGQPPAAAADARALVGSVERAPARARGRRLCAASHARSSTRSPRTGSRPTAVPASTCGFRCARRRRRCRRWPSAAGRSPPASASASGARPRFASPHRRWRRTMRGGLPRTSRRRFAHEQRRLREPRLDRGD